MIRGRNEKNTPFLGDIQLISGINSLYCLLIICLISINFSCRPKEEIFTPQSNVQVGLELDSLVFDTLFTARKSITRRLKIYNNLEKAIKIEQIKLGGGSNSAYNLYVNGQSGRQFGPLKLMGKDSMLVLVEVKVPEDDQETPFLIRDSLVIKTSGPAQQVKLLTWGQPVHYINELLIERDTVFGSKKPYVIRKKISVKQGSTLKVDSGTHLFFQKGASLRVNGKLLVEGVAGAPVIFRNDRFGGPYEKAPGQWQGIVFENASQGNKIQYARIQNAETGILLNHQDADTITDLIIEGSRIENMANAGVMTKNSDLKMVNTLVQNCKSYVVGNFGGGNYHYYHCTFVNLATDFFRDFPVLVMADNRFMTEEISPEAIRFEMKNTIVWGNFNNEAAKDSVNNSRSVLVLERNLLKTNDPELGKNNISGELPGFVAPGKHNFYIKEESEARDKGLNLGIKEDIKGNSRDNLPDIGAYEWVPESKKNK